MATSPSKTGTTDVQTDDDDWLGYGAYADALWSRVVRALEKDKGGKLLGDDPLVIGIFGDWGAGKSHLLKLVHRRAEEQSARDIAMRVLTAADDLTVPLTVTVPVMFQPWKYEHEPHLHVPLAIHVADALEDAWKKLPTDFEHVKVFVERATEGLADAAEKVEAAKGVMLQIGKIWGATKQIVHSNVTKVVAGTVDVAAMSFGVPPLLTGLLSKARDHVAEPDEDKEEATGKEKAKDTGKDQKVAKKTAAEKRTASFSHSEDGLAFYRIHKLMQAMSRPKIDGKTLKAAGLNIAKGIEFDLRINFVVFVDDLDRCLPEKAVETLELIKTTFNIESFAFVLALDDEVIERGIGHRYKEYQLVGKKPEMPITGFEYLEKIVHVPFRLPALTRAQATEFVREYEKQVEGDPARRWFDELTYTTPAPGQSLNEGASSSPAAARENAVQPTDMLELALSGFDAFMPRKLIRLVELLHQIAEIARLRERPLQLRPVDGIDVRVVLVILLIQLFQPEMFRLLRRRGDSFPTLLAAFAPRPAFDAVAAKQMPDIAPDLKSAAIADIDLWRWAVNPKMGDDEDWNPGTLESTHSYVVNRIANAFKGKPSDRTSAQQVRLPIVLQLIEHRSAHRHVFDVLKLTKRLADDMVRTGDKPHELVFDPYRSLLAKTSLVATVGEVMLQVPLPTVEAFGTVGNFDTSAESVQVRQTPALPTFAISNVDELAALLISPETEAQANVASRHELPTGRVMDQRTARNLATALKKQLEDAADSRPAKELCLLNGLQYLAPYVAEHGMLFWDLVKNLVDPQKETPPKIRALWGDVRDLLGCDDRFEPNQPYLFKTRFNGHSTEDEPVPGYVRIPAGQFQMGSKDDDDNPPRQVTVAKPYYISRTLVTVQQFSKFIEAGGYADGNGWWDSQGVAWRNGSLDSKVKDDYYQEWLASRSSDLRKMPMDWAGQRRLTNRPVVGVTWFEARAYSRWLNVHMRGAIVAAKLDAGFQVLLPTEDQWERAARAVSLVGADGRRWPWGDDESMADQQANLKRNVGNVSAVGVYPPNPIGLFDMAGNAWEWMDNLYAPKPNGFARIGLNQVLISEKSYEKSDLPSLRGGSRYSDTRDALCSLRYRNHFYDWYDLIGFRVVLSLAD